MFQEGKRCYGKGENVENKIWQKNVAMILHPAGFFFAVFLAGDMFQRKPIF